MEKQVRRGAKLGHSSHIMQLSDRSCRTNIRKNPGRKIKLLGNNSNSGPPNTHYFFSSGNFITAKRVSRYISFLIKRVVIMESSILRVFLIVGGLYMVSLPREFRSRGP